MDFSLFFYLIIWSYPGSCLFLRVIIHLFHSWSHIIHMMSCLYFCTFMVWHIEMHLHTLFFYGIPSHSYYLVKCKRHVDIHLSHVTSCTQKEFIYKMCTQHMSTTCEKTYETGSVYKPHAWVLCDFCVTRSWLWDIMHSILFVSHHQSSCCRMFQLGYEFPSSPILSVYTNTAITQEGGGERSVQIQLSIFIFPLNESQRHIVSQYHENIISGKIPKLKDLVQIKGQISAQRLCLYPIRKPENAEYFGALQLLSTYYLWSASWKLKISTPITSAACKKKKKKQTIQLVCYWSTSMHTRGQFWVFCSGLFTSLWRSCWVWESKQHGANYQSCNMS